MSNPDQTRQDTLRTGENVRGGLRIRRIAALVTDGVDAERFTAVRERLAAEGAVVEAVASHGGEVTGDQGAGPQAERALPTLSSDLYDAVLLPDGADPDVLTADPYAMGFLRDCYMHGRAVGALGSGILVLAALGGIVPGAGTDPEESGSGLAAQLDGVVTGSARGAHGTDAEFTDAFAEAIAADRHWNRPPLPSA
ncbi:DJ-1/PfpI family protein [Streptomyces sp. NPDC001205]